MPHVSLETPFAKMMIMIWDSKSSYVKNKIKQTKKKKKTENHKNIFYVLKYKHKKDI